MDWITASLAVGDVTDAYDPEGVDAVLNCAHEIPVNHALPCLRLDLYDGQAIPFVVLDRAMNFLRGHIRDGRRVLVHCWAGSSRSVAIAAAYLALQEGLEPREALLKVQEARAEANPHPMLWESVQDYVEAERLP